MVSERALERALAAFEELGKYASLRARLHAALTAAAPHLAAVQVNSAKIEAARKAVEELANVQMNLPLVEWSRISSAILSALAPSDTIESYYARQIQWSKNTFGPALRTLGILDHIRKELKEIEAEPHDLSEWIDVVILAMDGFWRHGGSVDDLMPRLLAKQQKNMARTWPDWRTMSEDAAIEHDRSKDAVPYAGRAAVLEEAARNLIANRFDTYKARNGKLCSIEGDDGEKCWIVSFDDMADLEAALASHPVADKPSDDGAQGEGWVMSPPKFHRYPYFVENISGKWCLCKHHGNGASHTISVHKTAREARDAAPTLPTPPSDEVA